MIFTIPKPPTHDGRIDHAGKHFRADCADHKLTIERDPGIFFFTTDGTMVHTSLDYLYSTTPLPTNVNVPKLGGK